MSDNISKAAASRQVSRACKEVADTLQSEDVFQCQHCGYSCERHMVKRYYVNPGRKGAPGTIFIKVGIA